MFTIIDLASVFFFADIPLQSLSQVHVGQQAIISFAQLPKREFPATVEAVNPQAEAASQTVKVRLRMSPRSAEDQTLMRAGIIGTAQIVVGMHRGALVVPREALIRDAENNNYSVIVVGADSIARKVEITVRTLTDRRAEIEGPIHSGMIVVTKGGYGLADSTRVSTVPHTPQ